MTQPLRETLDVSDGGQVAVSAHGSIRVTSPGQLLVDDIAITGLGGASLTADEQAALDAAPTPLTALNPVASVADVPAIPHQLCTVVHASPVGGGYVAQFLFDDTATTGGLYAWTGTDYTRVGLATS